MKNDHLFLIGGAFVLLLLMSKQAHAKAVVQPVPTLDVQTGGKPQEGVRYATPTQTAALVSGAVNGLLNWVSGTPKKSASAVSVNDILGSVDSSPAGDGSSPWSLGNLFCSDTPDGSSISGSGAGDLSTDNPLDSWTSGDWSLE